jgi:Domain of unknown function (DUF309)
VTVGPPRFVVDRVLPATPYLPGRSPRPLHDAGGGLAWGIDLYNAGYFWEAHESWEALWRVETDAAIRERLQGLILAAAACLKLVLGRRPVFVTLAARSATRLIAAGDPWARAFADALAAFAAEPEPDVAARPRLWLPP